MDREEFINSIKEGALKGYDEHRILPSLTIAQAILESSWGNSRLAVRARNLFGIKAFSSWRGERITLPTTEWRNDKQQIINADFRAYYSFNESIEDHNKLLANEKYKPVRFVQETLHAEPVDGEAGPITKNCVMQYQRNKNIEVDGIVGNQT